MNIYIYPNKKSYTSIDTDKFIIKSVQSLTGKKAEDVKISRTKYGKPYIENSDLHIGVTHTDGILIIALGFCVIGIDAEPENRALKKIDLIVERFFSDKEREYIYSGAGDLKRQRFIEVWVKKEAYIKHMGKRVFDIADADSYILQGNYKKIAVDGYVVYTYTQEEESIKIIDIRN